MNTGFIHNFSEEDNAECQQDNQDTLRNAWIADTALPES